MEKPKIKRDFPKRETSQNLPFLRDEHLPDQDGRTDYGRDKESTFTDKK
ncbi:MAG: hypothetical protein M0T74_09470 [Desulfitobacterium hafniense]|nr:hypothetical protein [Desulfitobacterium hafniense]